MNQRRESIAIIEYKWWGHHPTYVNLLADVAIELGLDVLCAVPCPDHVLAQASHPSVEPSSPRAFFRRTPHFRTLDRAMRVAGRLHLPRASVMWFYAAFDLRALIRTTRRRPTLTILGMVDDYLSESLSPSLIDRIFPFPWTGILIFPRALLAARAADAAASPPPMLRASRCLGLQVLDEGLIPFAEATYRIPFQHFPDVTNVTLAGDTQSPEGAEIVRRARSRLVTGLFGTLDRRKGILFLLEIIRKADPTKYFFAICGDAVGSPTPEFLAFLATLAREQHENVIFRRGRIPDGPPFNSLLVSSDVVFACYEDFPYSSNILTKAAAFRRPVLVSTKGLLAERVNRFHLGLAVTFGDADAAVSALAELDRRRHLPTDAQFEAYSVLHSRTSLLAALSTLVERARALDNSSSPSDSHRAR